MRIDNKKVEVTADISNHITVDVLDCSGSMGHYMLREGYGTKDTKIALGIAGIKEAHKSVQGEYNLVAFDNSIVVFYTPEDFKYTFGGSTALTDAIIKAFELAGDKRALINVYTDGGENGSKASSSVAAKLIRDNKDKVVVTFIGTSYDVDTAKRLYNLEDSNTLVYDNTAKGLSDAITTTQQSRAGYYKDLSEGKDVSKGFYKTISNN